MWELRGYASVRLLMVEGCTQGWLASASLAVPFLRQMLQQSSVMHVDLRFYFPALCILIPFYFFFWKSGWKKSRNKTMTLFLRGIYISLLGFVIDRWPHRWQWWLQWGRSGVEMVRGQKFSWKMGKVFLDFNALHRTESAFLSFWRLTDLIGWSLVKENWINLVYDPVS